MMGMERLHEQMFLQPRLTNFEQEHAFENSIDEAQKNKFEAAGSRNV